MTADFAIGPQSPISNPAARVINPDRGQSVKLAAFRIATVPVAPINVAVTTTRHHRHGHLGLPDDAQRRRRLAADRLHRRRRRRQHQQHADRWPGRPHRDLHRPDGRQGLQLHRQGRQRGRRRAGANDVDVAVRHVPDDQVQQADRVAGDYIHYTGKLTRTANGAGAPDAAIVVTLDPDVGPTRVFTTYTNSIGVWGFRYPTYYNMTVIAKFAGNATDKAATATTQRLGTYVNIVKKTPGTQLARHRALLPRDRLRQPRTRPDGWSTWSGATVRSLGAARSAPTARSTSSARCRGGTSTSR